MQPYTIQSVSELHRLLALPKPQHPLVSVINLEEIKCIWNEDINSVIYNFYSVCIKKDFTRKLKYGQNFYDFDEGVMTFFSPGQVISATVGDEIAINGIWLVIHPDFLLHYPLLKKIKEYGYFSYAVNEALHLSDKEEAMMISAIKNIEAEYCSSLDNYSQDVMISQIELLLSYANRFYGRQFITRKHAGNDLLERLESILSGYFENEIPHQKGLPTVQYLSSQLNVSSHYLSDMLRTFTGQSTQQHIQEAVIKKAKEILTTTSFSVSEIAYSLGFEYPQSFNKLFKNKMQVSPLAFRQSFN